MNIELTFFGIFFGGWFSAQTSEDQNLKLDGLRFCGRDASIFQACDFAFLLTYRTIFLMDKHYHLLAYRKKSIYNRNWSDAILFKVKPIFFNQIFVFVFHTRVFLVEPYRVPKGQLISKSRLARRRFSQKTNGWIWFVCREE